MDSRGWPIGRVAVDVRRVTPDRRYGLVGAGWGSRAGPAPVAC